MAYRMDFFAGTYEKVIAAIESGKVSYPAYVLIRDEAKPDTIQIGFVDKGNVLKLSEDKNESEKQIINVETLPDVSEGNVDKLYIVANKDAYIFNGEEFAPIAIDRGAEIAELAEKLTTLEEKVDANDEKANHVFTKRKYEISTKPTGTLVDYRDAEIRVMCPVDTKWEKQNVGPTGNGNMYYMGFKAYAPENAVGFKEGDQGVIKDEYFDFSGDFAGTDEFGRNYSICWLALASYDEASDTWTYFGKNSTTEKYIGWTYVVEWYDEVGTVIEYDSIRINLSNESCHSVVEPYYMGQVKGMIDEVAILNEKVKELEASTVTFIELE